MHTPWYILGAGAIGSIFASSIHRAGLPLVLLQKSPGNDSKRNLRIDSAKGTFQFSLPLSVNAETAPIQKLLVCTKAYDVYPALMQVAHRLNGNSRIIVMVNGMGFMDRVSEALPDLEITMATTTEGVYRVGPNHYCHAGEGLTRMGESGLKRSPEWFNEWLHLDRPSVWEPEIERVLWEKLAVNCAINPLTALRQCSNGELARQQDLATRVDQLCAEISRVSAALQFHSIAEGLHSRVVQVIADTALNQSSMLQDILAGRRTENEYITGYLVEAASRLGIEAPYNTDLFERIRRLEQARMQASTTLLK